MSSPPDFLATHRTGIIVFVVLATLAALPGILRLEFDDDYRRVFRSGDSELALLEELSETFGSDENELVVVLEADDALSSEAIETLQRVEWGLLGLEGIDSVMSVLNLAEARALPGNSTDSARNDSLRRVVLEHPLVANQLLSPERDAALLFARLEESDWRLEEIEPLLSEVRQLLRNAPQGASVRLHLAGIPSVRQEIVRGVQRDQVLFTTVGFFLGALILRLVYRHWSAVLIVALGPATGVCWTMGALGWLGESVNVLNNAVPALVIVIAMTDAVHVFHRFRAERESGRSAEEAASLAVSTVGRACLLATLTTAAGFASLATAEIDIVRRFGLSCALGVTLSFLAVVTVVPLVAGSRLGRRATHWRTGAEPSTAERARLSRLTEPFLRSPAVTATLGVTLFVALSGLCLGLRPDYDYVDELPSRGPTRKTLELLDSRFGGSLPIHGVVGWSAEPRGGVQEIVDVLRQVEQLFDLQPEIARPVSFADLIDSIEGAEDDLRRGLLPPPQSLPELSKRLFRPDLRRALVSARMPSLGAAQLSPLFDGLQSRFREIENRHPDFDVRLAGLLVVTTQTSLTMSSTLATSLGAAALVIFGTLTITFRSLRLGLASIIPNFLPLAAIGAALVLRGGSLQYTSVTVFSICLGLAVDDSIHLLAGFRRQSRAGHPLPTALRKSLEQVGPALVMTTALLLAGFGAIGLSSHPMIRLNGILCCLAFVVALAADLFLLPPLLLVTGRRPGAGSTTGGAA